MWLPHLRSPQPQKVAERRAEWSLYEARDLATDISIFFGTSVGQCLILKFVRWIGAVRILAFVLDETLHCEQGDGRVSGSALRVN
jgi:hypothetical protein